MSGKDDDSVLKKYASIDDLKAEVDVTIANAKTGISEAQDIVRQFQQQADQHLAEFDDAFDRMKRLTVGEIIDQYMSGKPLDDLVKKVVH